MKTTVLTMEAEMSDASAPSVIEPYVIGYMKTGHLPVEIFRRLELGAGPEAPEPEETVEQPLFGTHIREAIEVLRGRRS